jgi:hypothetical protein
VGSGEPAFGKLTMASRPDNAIRLAIADTLSSIADSEGWDDQLSKRFDELLKQTEVDQLLSHADEELTHYSGEFNARNLLGMKMKPDKNSVADYKETFKDIANAIREGTSWEQYRRANNIYESGDFTRWLKARLAKLRR